MTSVYHPPDHGYDSDRTANPCLTPPPVMKRNGSQVNLWSSPRVVPPPFSNSMLIPIPLDLNKPFISMSSLLPPSYLSSSSASLSSSSSSSFAAVSREDIAFNLTSSLISLYSNSIDGNCVLQNAAAAKLFKATKLTDLIVLARHRDLMNETLITEGKFKGEILMYCKEATRWMSVEAFKTDDPANPPEKVVVVTATDAEDYHMQKIITANTGTKQGDWEWNLSTNKCAWSLELFEDSNLASQLQQYNNSSGACFPSIHPDDQQTVKDAIEQSITYGHPWKCMYRTTCGRRTRTLMSCGDVVNNILGKPVRIIGTVHDITPVDPSSDPSYIAKFLDVAVNSTESTVIAIGREGNVTYMNKIALSFFKVPSPLSGSGSTQVFPPLDDICNLCYYMDGTKYKKEDLPLMRSLRGETVKNTKILLKLPNQEDKCVLINSQPLFFSSGGICGAVSASRDVTDTERIKDSVEQSKATAAKLRREFVTNLSHEVRTPFNGILGMITLALQEQLPPKAKKYMELAEDSTHSLLHVLNNLMDFSLFEERKAVLSPVDFSLRDCISTISFMYIPLALQKEVSIDFDIDQKLVDNLNGDFRRLCQIISNLMDNAIKFAKPRGKIKLKCELWPHIDDGASSSVSDVGLHFQVIDDGDGVPEDKRDMLFDAFYQVDGSDTRKQGGLGLGLYICANLVKLFRGKIWYDSVAGEGSTFHFTVMLSQSTNAKKEGTPVLISSGGIPSSSPGLLPSLSYSTRPSPISPLPPLPNTPGMMASTISSTMSSVFSPLSSLNSSVNSLSSSVSSLSGSTSAPMSPIIQESPRRKNFRRSDSQLYVLHPTMHFLVVEDNHMNQKIITRMLTKMNCTFTIACNGREAVDLFQRAFLKVDRSSRHIDCILMDIQMPEMSGIEATAMIRQMEKENLAFVKVPIIGVSAHISSDVEKQNLIDLGMNAYIPKPVDQALLHDAIIRTRN
eukprot:TRINITY_DN3460_c0_g1_i1.p1 TRINITY_DN3460_c0_g1~~TRINITY_DN3460_c0_g1_i1.p1  ORF type:complete len:962 (+),score=261.26 TRINITY_DN3460_c0_g1_i1:3262-6147(+)